MRTLLLGAALAALLQPACKRDDACTTLTDKLCDGGAIACDRVATWLDTQLAGPDGKPLPTAQRTAACDQLLTDADALTGFREAARAALAH